MSHEINSMAYVGEKPWHGLGNLLPTNASIETWSERAGMQWHIKDAPLQYEAQGDILVPMQYKDHKVLYRSDTLAPLSVVSRSYRIVQPSMVLEFFRDLVGAGGYELETAGCLKGGRRFWALARMKEIAELPGDDKVEAFLLLATSCDGTLSTTVQPTSIRVVCSNTLHASLEGATGGIRVPHSKTFEPKPIQEQLLRARAQWESYATLIQALSRKRMTASQAVLFFSTALGALEEDGGNEAKLRKGNALAQVQALYAGQGLGSELKAAKGTVWGALNAVTEYMDHKRRVRSEDNRLSSAWFGRGARVKQNALDMAAALISS